MDDAITMQVTVYLEGCITCGIQFGVPGDWRNQKRRDHTNFYCPNGHLMHFPGESEVEIANRLKIKAENDAQSKINEANHRALVAEREAEKELKKRRTMERKLRGGVCPCCNRTFEDLARHMGSKNKEFGLPPGKNLKLITGTNS